MDSNRLIADIDDSVIKILYGTQKKIKRFGLIPVPKGSMTANRMLDLDLVSNAIHGFLSDENINTKNISYVIHGQDIVVRNLEVPAISEKNIEESVQWELNHGLPDGGKNYCLSHQISGSEGSGKARVFKILAVAAPSERIEQYVELSDRLNMNLLSIDISGNSIARQFRRKKKLKEDNGTGVIYFGNEYMRMHILEKGNLAVEREVLFGLENLVREILKRHETEDMYAWSYLSDSFSLVANPEDNELNERLIYLINNVLSSFQKVIQFYATGRTIKSLDEIFITGPGAFINGLDQYVARALGANTTLILSPSDIGAKPNVPNGFDFKHFLSAYGMLLRRENQ
jgi:Tfp pilus assembly protein, ATPase PilM